MDSDESRQNQLNVRKRFEELKVPMSSKGNFPHQVSVTGDVITLTVRCKVGDVDKAIAVIRTAIAEAERH